MRTREEIAIILINIAKEKIGAKEIPDGSNSGPLVDKIILKAGGRIGEPWCADTVTCNVMDACEHLGIHYPKGLYRGSSSQGFLTSDEKYHLFLPLPGCAFVHTNIPHDGHGHTGIAITEAGDGGAYSTVEGNFHNQCAEWTKTMYYANKFIDLSQALLDQCILEGK